MKNRFVKFCGFFFLFINTIHAQDAQRVDSLLAIYNNEQSADTLKIKVLGELFDAYKYYDQVKAGHYLSLSYDLAKKTNNEYEIARYYGSKGVLFDINGQADSSRIYYKKAIAYFEKNNINDKLEIVRFNLGMIEQSAGNFQTALDLVEKNIQAHPTVTKKNARILAMSYGLKCRVYWKKGYYNLALKNGLKQFNIIEPTGNELRTADALKDLARVEHACLLYTSPSPRD